MKKTMTFPVIESVMNDIELLRQEIELLKRQIKEMEHENRQNMNNWQTEWRSRHGQR